MRNKVEVLRVRQLRSEYEALKMKMMKEAELKEKIK
jgi:hypothetical protein